jgi:hypothetical protein
MGLFYSVLIRSGGDEVTFCFVGFLWAVSILCSLMLLGSKCFKLKMM